MSSFRVGRTFANWPLFRLIIGMVIIMEIRECNNKNWDKKGKRIRQRRISDGEIFRNGGNGRQGRMRTEYDITDTQDSTDDNNYSTVDLSLVIFKLYTRIVENWLRSIIKDKMEEEGEAFRKRIMTIDNIFIVRNLIERKIEDC